MSITSIDSCYTMFLKAQRTSIKQLLCIIHGHQSKTCLQSESQGPSLRLTSRSSADAQSVYFRHGFIQCSASEPDELLYKKCIQKDFITNITGAGDVRDPFQLNETRHYYFISGLGQCDNGVKLSINVENAPAPQSTPHYNASLDVKSLSGMKEISLCKPNR
ncbi:hypothetical protein QQ045_011979 [Rhodiola kirilowii]